MEFKRITTNPEVFGGKPCIRGLRFPVSRLLGLLAAGESREAILDAYPYLEPGDIDDTLRYAAALAIARREGRAVVTTDLDFPRLLALTAAGGPAVVLFRGGALSDSEMLALMERVLNTVSIADLEESLTVVERTRVRRTRLPLRSPENE